LERAHTINKLKRLPEIAYCKPPEFKKFKKYTTKANSVKGRIRRIGRVF